MSWEKFGPPKFGWKWLVMYSLRGSWVLAGVAQNWPCPFFPSLQRWFPVFALIIPADKGWTLRPKLKSVHPLLPDGTELWDMEINLCDPRTHWNRNKWEKEMDFWCRRLLQTLIYHGCVLGIWTWPSEIRLAFGTLYQQSRFISRFPWNFFFLK